MSSRGDVKELVAKYYNVRIFGISRQMNMEISSRKIERPPDGFVPSCVLFVIAVVSFRYLSTTKFFTLRMQAIIQGVTVHVEPKKLRKKLHAIICSIRFRLRDEYNEIFVSILRYLIIFTEDARYDRVAFQGESVDALS